MNNKVILEWTFSPPYFLESVLTEEDDEYQLVIDNGKAVAVIDADFFDAHPQIRSELHSKIYKRLQGAQLVKYQNFTLDDSRMTRVDPDGRKTHFLEAKGTLVLTSVYSGDFQVRDAHGNIIADTRQDRIDEISTLGMRLAKYSGDVTLEGLLSSLGESYNDPDNAFIHLFEIRDALETKFGKGYKFKKCLGMDHDQDKRFVKLCNNRFLRQGRHRGNAVGQLRTATDAELREARDFARVMIEAYLRQLENSAPLGDAARTSNAKS